MKKEIFHLDKTINLRKVGGFFVKKDRESVGYFSGNVVFGAKRGDLQDYVLTLGDIPDLQIMDFFVWKWRGNFYPAEELHLPEGDVFGWNMGDAVIVYQPGDLYGSPVVNLLYSEILYFFRDDEDYELKNLVTWTLQDGFGEYSLILGQADGPRDNMSMLGTYPMQALFRPVRTFPWERARSKYDIGIGGAPKYSEYEIEIDE